MGETKILEKMQRKIHQEWKLDNPEDRYYTELDIFMAGRRFIDFGTIRLRDVYKMLQARLLFIQFIEIDREIYEYVELHPDFRRACDLYQPPSNFIPRDEMIDDYERPFDPAEFLAPENEIEFNPDDPRGEDVYLFSEKKLRQELKTRKRDWLIYRTPYRPDDPKWWDQSIWDGVAKGENLQN